MHKRTGFTLIELLVVIAIIALLMGILMPALQKVKKQAQAATCLSNLRQIGVAAYMYAEDNDTFIPRGTTSVRYLWFVQFLPYLGQQHNTGDYKTVKIYECKSFPRTGNGLNSISNAQQTVCYVINGWSFSSSTDMEGEVVSGPTKLSVFRRPAQTVYLAENEAGSWRPIVETEDSASIMLCDIWQESHLPQSETTDIYNGRRVANERHREGSNVLFLDWHSEYIAAEDHTITLWRDK